MISSKAAQLSAQLDAVQATLDKILAILTALQQSEEAATTLVLKLGTPVPTPK